MAATPIPRIVMPLTITANSNDRIAFRADANILGAARSYVGTVAAGTYTTTTDLASAVLTAIQGATSDTATGEWLADAEGYAWVAITGEGRCKVTLSALTASSSYAFYWSAPPLRANSTAYALGDLVYTSAGRVYLCETAGTSGNSEPTGETASVADGAGTLVWSYQGRTSYYTGLAAALGFATTANDTGTSGSSPAWAASTSYEKGALVTNDSGKVYYATTGGISAGSGGPTGTSSPISDGSVVWSYLSTGEMVTATSDYVLPTIWSPDVPATEDVERELESTVTHVRTAGGQSKLVRWTATSLNGRLVRRRVRFNFVAPERTFTDEATSTNTNKAYESFWRGSYTQKFRYEPDRTDAATGDDWFLAEDSVRDFRPERVAPSVELYGFALEMQEYQA